MTTEEKLVVDLLEGAAEQIERRGWIQGFLERPEGLCAMGGIHRAIDELCMKYDLHTSDPILSSAYSRAANEVSQVVDAPVAMWNDTPGRTKQEVLDALHKAAKRIQGVED